ncbi:LysE family translocator [Halomonas dongshanensis]|uniref:LysE family translocator n=1 Tax=Halomonas dongshanensis TaxID=2890835 RepID=A0ABT2EGH0_9GAMM|nr:LysE family translocator [Halomonas dongshanensis]MCS2610676.1 LysE family translocator [Halomonas dongshanensis]
MSDSLIIQLFQISLFAAPLVISPGPNNLLVTTNCAQFGYRRTLPSLTGISLGVFVLFMAVALGLGGVLSRYPALHTILKVIGSAYILYLAFKLYTSNSSGTTGDEKAQPITLSQAALLQVLNPKIWLLAATATSTFLPLTGKVFTDAILLSITLALIFFPCNSVWAMGGLMMRQLLHGRTFFRIMGFLTASSVIFLLI